jgi:hypothetical protein
MLSKLLVATVIALILSPLGARATVVTGTFSGGFYDGTDTTGVFETAGSDLTGAAVTGTFSYNTSLLTPSIVGTTNTATGSPGALTVTMTINGNTYIFTDPSSSSVYVDTSVSEITLQNTNTVGSTYETFYLDASSFPGFITTTDLAAQDFSELSPLSATGSFLIGDPGAVANGDFTLTSITASPPVPEPASMTLLLVGLGGIAVRRKRRG